jgi:DNA-binding transcriptional LysR family regulator
MRVVHNLRGVQLDLIRSFLTVVEEGSLNRAAARLHLVQSSLTRQMQALEHEIGGRLFERSANGVAPTAAGNALAGRMERVLVEFDSGVAEARRVARGQRAQLRIGYLLSAGQKYLGPALAVLRREHPAVKVKLSDMSPGEQIRALRAGTIDVALIGQEGCQIAREFYARKLATLPVVAALPEHHALAERATVRLADLRGEMFVGSPEDQVPGRNRWVARLCRHAGFRPRFAQEADSLGHALSLVVSDGLVALAPDFVQEMKAPGVSYRPVSDPSAKWDFLVVWQRGKIAEPVRALLDALPGARSSGPR